MREVLRHSTAANQATELPLEDQTLRSTAIIDFHSNGVRAALLSLNKTPESPVDYLRTAHLYLRTEIAAVYTVDELQPVSLTLAKRKGSCSQRFACLEAFSRAAAIATQVRGLWIDGQFWAPRFTLTRLFIPNRVLLALPQFYIKGGWLDVEELFGATEVLARNSPSGFTNDGESLFDAVSEVAIDFRGKSASCEGAHCNLSHYVLGDAGTFTTRDELFSHYPLFQKTLRGRAFERLYGGRKSN